MEDKKWWKRMTDEMQIKLSDGIRYYGNSNFRFKKDYALNFNGKTYWSDDIVCSNRLLHISRHFI